MNELIRIEVSAISGEPAQTCDARELHQFLEVGKVFAAWIQERIEQYGFEQGKDYEVFSDSGNNPQGGRPSKEYTITIDMAKELAMVERNEKGKQARQYFIECERRAKAAPAAVVPTPTIEAFKLAPLVVRAARAMGLDKNAAAISANQAVAKLTGTNVLKLLGHTHLEAENQAALYFTPTELGERLGISGRKFNMLLAEAGLQAKKGEHWVPLTTAEGFCRIMDTGKRHGDGTMIQQIKWANNVLALIEKAAA